MLYKRRVRKKPFIRDFIFRDRRSGAFLRSAGNLVFYPAHYEALSLTSILRPVRLYTWRSSEAHIITQPCISWLRTTLPSASMLLDWLRLLYYARQSRYSSLSVNESPIYSTITNYAPLTGTAVETSQNSLTIGWWYSILTLRQRLSMWWDVMPSIPSGDNLKLFSAVLKQHMVESCLTLVQLCSYLLRMAGQDIHFTSGYKSRFPHYSAAGNTTAFGLSVLPHFSIKAGWKPSILRWILSLRHNGAMVPKWAWNRPRFLMRWRFYPLKRVRASKYGGELWTGARHLTQSNLGHRRSKPKILRAYARSARLAKNRYIFRTQYRVERVRRFARKAHHYSRLAPIPVQAGDSANTLSRWYISRSRPSAARPQRFSKTRIIRRFRVAARRFIHKQRLRRLEIRRRSGLPNKRNTKTTSLELKPIWIRRAQRKRRLKSKSDVRGLRDLLLKTADKISKQPRFKQLWSFYNSVAKGRLAICKDRFIRQTINRFRRLVTRLYRMQRLGLSSIVKTSKKYAHIIGRLHRSRWPVYYIRGFGPGQRLNEVLVLSRLVRKAGKLSSRLVFYVRFFSAWLVRWSRARDISLSLRISAVALYRYFVRVRDGLFEYVSKISSQYWNNHQLRHWFRVLSGPAYFAANRRRILDTRRLAGYNRAVTTALHNSSRLIRRAHLVLHSYRSSLHRPLDSSSANSVHAPRTLMFGDSNSILNVSEYWFEILKLMTAGPSSVVTIPSDLISCSLNLLQRDVVVDTELRYHAVVALANLRKLSRNYDA